MRRRALLIAPAALSWGLAGAAERTLRVAVAANLRSVFPALAKHWRAGGGPALTVSYGASGIFTRQLERGAPFDLFLSADSGFAERLAGRGLTRGPPRVYALGRCALLVHPRAGFSGTEPAARVLADVAGRTGERFSIANPEHAPYGRAARDILVRHGLGADGDAHRLNAENAAQATRWVAGGHALAGIVPASLAIAASADGAARHWLLPADWHRPLPQALVVMRSAAPAADALADWLTGPDAAAILAAAGYGVP